MVIHSTICPQNIPSYRITHLNIKRVNPFESLHGWFQEFAQRVFAVYTDVFFAYLCGKKKNSLVGEKITFL